MSQACISSPVYIHDHLWSPWLFYILLDIIPYSRLFSCGFNFRKAFVCRKLNPRKIQQTKNFSAHEKFILCHVDTCAIRMSIEQYFKRLPSSQEKILPSLRGSRIVGLFQACVDQKFFCSWKIYTLSRRKRMRSECRLRSTSSGCLPPKKRFCRVCTVAELLAFFKLV